MTDDKPKLWFTPIRHKHHTDGKPCGCWTGQDAPITRCPICGAGYLSAEVMEFPIWQCYDCGAGWRTC